MKRLILSTLTVLLTLVAGAQDSLQVDLKFEDVVVTMIRETGQRNAFAR